jgi:hypothetical protein
MKEDAKAKPKDIEKVEKECQKKKSDAAAREETYKKQVVDTNSFLEKYYGEKMPRVLAVNKDNKKQHKQIKINKKN